MTLSGARDGLRCHSFDSSDDYTDSDHDRAERSSQWGRSRSCLAGSLLLAVGLSLVLALVVVPNSLRASSSFNKFSISAKLSQAFSFGLPGGGTADDSAQQQAQYGASDASAQQQYGAYQGQQGVAAQGSEVYSQPAWGNVVGNPVPVPVPVPAPAWGGATGAQEQISGNWNTPAPIWNTPAPTVSQYTPPAPAVPASLRNYHWLICLGLHGCGKQTWQKWQTDPHSLASKVGDFSSVPGIDAKSYSQVAEKWQATPPTFNGRQITLSQIADFAKDVLKSDPFGTGGSVPYVDMGSRNAGEEAKVVAITQRQLAFLVANTMMANTIPAGNGLTAAFQRCSAKSATGFVYSMLSFLAILSQELTDGSQGNVLIAATPQNFTTSWKQRLQSHVLETPTLCSKSGSVGQSNCTDFMAGGTPHQALTDIAGRVVGGGAELCNSANTQDESLVIFYSEVLAFAFFAADGKMLFVPWTLLGARRYLSDITGQTGLDGRCGIIQDTNWLNQQITREKVDTTLLGSPVTVAANAFTAVRSKCSACANSCSTNDAMNNKCDAQRRHLDTDIGYWYQSFEPTMYDPSIMEAFVSVVQRVGTGPWGAGAWFGDSQQYFLAVWLATTLLIGARLDYYMYDHFCENPGNQCFVLGAQGCSSCLAKSNMGAALQNSQCGQVSVQQIVDKFAGRPVHDLYTAMQSVGGPPAQVFDLLINA